MKPPSQVWKPSHHWCQSCGPTTSVSDIAGVRVALPRGPDRPGAWCLLPAPRLVCSRRQVCSEIGWRGRIGAQPCPCGQCPQRCLVHPRLATAPSAPTPAQGHVHRLLTKPLCGLPVSPHSSAGEKMVTLLSRGRHRVRHCRRGHAGLTAAVWHWGPHADGAAETGALRLRGARADRPGLTGGHSSQLPQAWVPDSHDARALQTT